jgi:uncharacterized protein involved in type VI secretion and phage assembly
MDNLRARIKFDIAKQQFNVLSLSGTEAISVPFKFTIDIITNNAIDANSYISTPAVLQLAKRNIPGIITAAKETLLDYDKIQINIILEPHLVLAKLTKSMHIFLDQSVPDIVQKILPNYGYEKTQLQFHLNKNHPSKPYRLQIQQETDFAFLHRLLNKAGIYYWHDSDDKTEIMHFSDDNSNSPYVVNKIIYDPSDTEAGINKLIQHNGKIIAQSNLCDLEAGFCVKLDNTDYLIQQIQHQAAQNIEQQGQEIAYHNSVTLHPRNVPFAPPISASPKLSGNYIAHIESTGRYAQLDAIGNYRLRHRFDLSDAPNASASPPLIKLSPHDGWHQPLQQEAEVLVSTLHGDPDRPLVLGTIPNAKQISPTRALNKPQNIIRTQGNNQLLMDDTKNQQKVQLTTYSNHNLLELNADQDNPQINLTTNQGAMEWRAQQNIQFQSDANITTNIDNDHIQTSNQNHKIQTQQQDIHYQAATQQNLTAQNNTRYQTEKNIENINNNLTTQSKRIELTTEGDTLFNTQQKDLSLKNIKNANLIGKGKVAFMQNSSSGLYITSTAIDLCGSTVNFLVAAGVALTGQINSSSSASMTPAAAIPTSLQAQQIPELTLPDEDQPLKSEPENYHFNDEYVTQFNPFSQTLHSSKWHIRDQTSKSKTTQLNNKEIKLPKNIENTKIKVQTEVKNA